MRAVLALLLLCACLPCAIPRVHADELTIARLFASPDLNGPRLRMPRIAPDGTRVTFLRAAADDQHRFDLWQYEVATQREQRLVDASTLGADADKQSAESQARSPIFAGFTTAMDAAIRSSSTRTIELFRSRRSV